MRERKQRRTASRTQRGSNPVTAVHRALRAITRHLPPLARAPALYEHPYIAADVVRYRAAAIALAYLESILWKQYCGRRLNCHREPSPAILLQAMSDWRGLFSPDGVPYRALNRTLMNLPDSVPPELVCHLNQVRLERPITNPLELKVLLVVVSSRRAAGTLGNAAYRTRIFQRATASQIIDAFDRIASATGRRLAAAGLEDIRFALQFLADYPEPCAGNLTALVQKAIRWKRETPADIGRWTAGSGGSEIPTARPPLPLPDIRGITFLGTVGAVVVEGRRMRHCIGTYAQDAVRGKCFLFHVDYRGESASIEVNARGIGQVCGPQNTENAAAAWGSKQLRTWAAALCASMSSRIEASAPAPSSVLP